jgi:hypothetical protein
MLVEVVGWDQTYLLHLAIPTLPFLLQSCRIDTLEIDIERLQPTLCDSFESNPREIRAVDFDLLFQYLFVFREPGLVFLCVTLLPVVNRILALREKL